MEDVYWEEERQACRRCTERTTLCKAKPSGYSAIPKSSLLGESAAWEVSDGCCLPKLGLANLRKDSKVDWLPHQLLCNRSRSGLELFSQPITRGMVLADDSTRSSFPQHPRIHTLRKVLLHDQMSLCKRSIPDHCVNIVNTHTDITFKRCETLQSGAGYVNTIVDFFFLEWIQKLWCVA